MPLINKAPPSRADKLDHNKEHGAQQLFQMTIGANLFHWRKWRGISQSELATKANVTQPMVSEIERGDSNPTTDVLTKLATALEIQPQLLTRNDLSWRLLEVVDYMISKLPTMDVLKIMKLVYLIDLESLEATKNKLIGRNYVRYNRGPFNKAIYQIDDVFPKKDKVFDTPQAKNYMSLKDEDKIFVDTILEKYGSMGSSDIMKYTYTTAPMQGCTLGGEERMGEVIL